MISRSICKSAAVADAAPPPRSRVPVGRFPAAAAASVRALADCAYFIIILYGAAVVRVNIMGKEIFLFLNEPAGYQRATGGHVADPVPADRFGHH